MILYVTVIPFHPEKDVFFVFIFQSSSFFDKNKDDGTMVIKIREDGQSEKSWNSIKNANRLTPVRTSGRLGSASPAPFHFGGFRPA